VADLSQWQEAFARLLWQSDPKPLAALMRQDEPMPASVQYALAGLIDPAERAVRKLKFEIDKRELGKLNSLLEDIADGLEVENARKGGQIKTGVITSKGKSRAKLFRAHQRMERLQTALDFAARHLTEEEQKALGQGDDAAWRILMDALRVYKIQRNP
jgi:hypothetical protein